MTGILSLGLLVWAGRARASVSGQSPVTRSSSVTSLADTRLCSAVSKLTRLSLPAVSSQLSANQENII